MKKILALLLAVMMLCCLVACGDDTPSEPISQRSIPKAASVETALKSTKFTIDCNHASELWAKSAMAGLEFTFTGMYANGGRTIRASFLGSLGDGKTVTDFFNAYKTEKAINFSKQTWSDADTMTIAGYTTTHYSARMGMEGVSNGQEYHCYFIDADGEIFLIELIQDDRADSTVLEAHEMDSVNALLKDIVITPIA